MSPNLYDLLDVAEDATVDEIRAAWKAAVADLDPTDRRFRAYNDAASVLLDPDKRAEYDAGLAAQRAEDGDEDDEDDEADGDDPVVATAPAEDDDELEAPVETDDPIEEPVAAPAPASDVDKSTVGAAAGSSPARPGPPGWSLWAAGVAAVLAVALAVWVLTLPGVRAEESPAEAAAVADVVRDAGNSAQLAARDAIVPLLGYDYRTMDADLVRIQDRMTEDMADRQARSWEALTEEAEKQKIVVTAEAPYVGLTRVSGDGERATVVAFIDQFVTKRGTEPFTLQMWATLSLVRDGGDWLLDDICTEGDCG